MVFHNNSDGSALFNPWQRNFRAPINCDTGKRMDLTLCNALQNSAYDYMLLMPTLWAVAIFMYFGVTFLIVAIELVRRNREIEHERQSMPAGQPERNRLLGLPEELHPNSVMMPTITQEMAQISSHSIDDMNTISSYASMTARGNTALTVFTVLTSITTMFLVGVRAVLLPGYGVCGNVSLKIVGAACLFFTGLMPTKDPRTDNGGARIFNGVFTGFLAYSLVGRIVTFILHLGGVFWYIGLTLISFLLLDDILSVPLFGVSLALLGVLVAMSCLQCTAWIHKNILLFLAELLLVFTVTVGSVFVELMYIGICTRGTSTVAFYVLVIPVVIVTIVGILVWNFEPPHPSSVVSRSVAV